MTAEQTTPAPAAPAPNPDAPTGTPVQIKTEPFRTFLKSVGYISDELILTTTKERATVSGVDKSSTFMCKNEYIGDLGYVGALGIPVDTMLSVIPPKAESIQITLGKRILIESPGFKGNIIPLNVDTCTKKIKGDIPVVNPFQVDAVELYEKVSALKSAFKDELSLVMIAVPTETEQITLTAGDNLVGDVTYRLLTSATVPMEWRRMYSFDLLMPILRQISQMTKTVGMSFMEKRTSSGDSALVLTGRTSDNTVEFTYVFAPRVES